MLPPAWGAIKAKVDKATLAKKSRFNPSNKLLFSSNTIISVAL